MTEEISRVSMSPAPRWALGLFPGLHALIYLWGAALIPYHSASFIFWLLALVGSAHLVTSILAIVTPRFASQALRIASWLSLFIFFYPAFEIMRNAAYLSALYGDLGEGIGIILLVMLAPLALVTLPIAAWGLWVSRRAGLTGRLPLAVGVGLLFAASVIVFIDRTSARASALIQIAPDDVETLALLREAHDAIFDEGERNAEPPRARRLYKRDAMDCSHLGAGSEATAAILFLGPSANGRGVSVIERCVRAAPDSLARAIFEIVRDEAIERSPVKIDLYQAAAKLRPRNALLGTFSIRPGLDGVCNEERCLMPWQLVARSEFSANQPIPYIPDLRFGVSAERLRARLGEVQKRDATNASSSEPEPPRLDGLYRLETLSFLRTSEGELIQLVRGKEPEVGLDRLDEALALAEAHIADAQRADGFFRYRLDPHMGREHAGWSIPRQAGTTLVVCELGRDDERTAEVAARSISLMLRDARTEGELTALGTRSRFSLGETALPLISIYSCLSRSDEIDRSKLAGLTRFLLKLQRESGGFYPAYEFSDPLEPGSEGGLVDGPEPLYAGGQAVFALTLAERFVIESPEEARALGLPSREELGEAVERAMNFYAGPYWPRFLRELFFLEENWHCLAARAALAHHRNEAYENFCLDYARFKSRLVLDDKSRVAPELKGGHSLGNIIVPSNTPTAGLGEALAGAMAIKEARGDDLSADRETMRLILEYLLRQQWTPRNCFACTTHRNVLGGFSEAITIPEIRIDYTQHAWAALGHGGRFLVEGDR